MITRRIASQPAGSLMRGPWICPSCTHSSFLSRTTRSSSVRLQPTQRRNLHNVPQLLKSFEEDGVPGLYSKEGFNVAWTQCQNILVNKLNELTAGEPIENTRPKDLAIMFARDPMNANLFNYASAAHNNHQFFSNLTMVPKDLDNNPELKASLENTFGSIETLRSTMLDTAASMFGPGYVWLVWARDASENKKRSWRILTTYLAGTPYAEAGYRQQGIDMATNNSSSFQDYYSRQPVANTAGSFGAHSAVGQRQSKLPPGGTSVIPVLCVSTWEHSYIYDFGLAGKRAYLNRWWSVIDWSSVSSNAPTEAKPLSNMEFSR